MSKKKAKPATRRNGETIETVRQRNVRHERDNQPYGQHTRQEKEQFMGTCAFDVLAAASMVEQIREGDEATVPNGIRLPQDYLDNPSSVQNAFETTSKHTKEKDEIMLGCMTCLNTVGANVVTGDVIGQKMCQKYCRDNPIQFKPKE